MSSRPQLDPMPVITNGSMAGSIISLVTIVKKLSMLSYSLSWSGSSPVGSIVVEVSNDYAQNVDGSVKTAGTWNALPLSAATTVSGNTGNGFIDIDAQAGYALRCRYVRSSGSGTLQCIAVGKVQ